MEPKHNVEMLLTAGNDVGYRRIMERMAKGPLW
jgi:hypothetical protein